MDFRFEHVGLQIMNLCIATSSTSPGPCGISHLYAPATLKSPLYPSSYPNSIDCNWTISYTNGSRILLTFSSFSLESHSLCNYDYLDVYDGDSSYAKKLGRYCGSQLPQSIISSGSHLFIAFHSDGSQQKQGFVLNFTNKFGELADLFLGIIKALWGASKRN
ncbi:tolloid-like protein 2 [Dendronephthya gigantea]|uniref:tolloid-like protein 2 n=1 Tax=Dendronephthya gigantea TaxID=151771 RepID=UPI00106CACF8|nr:tolloid-like protein 2 [Dendronephthya gigantea]